MTERHNLFTADAPRPKGPYSQAVVANGVLYVAGQGPVDPVTQDFIEGSAEVQIRATLSNLAAVVRAAGTELSNTLKVNVYLQAMNDFDILNTVYREFFESPYPARTTVQSNLPGFAVEIDAIVSME